MLVRYMFASAAEADDRCANPVRPATEAQPRIRSRRRSVTFPPPQREPTISSRRSISIDAKKETTSVLRAQSFDTARSDR